MRLFVALFYVLSVVAPLYAVDRQPKKSGEHSTLYDRAIKFGFLDGKMILKHSRRDKYPPFDMNRWKELSGSHVLAIGMAKIALNSSDQACRRRKLQNSA